jgi:hypothetical protein
VQQQLELRLVQVAPGEVADAAWLGLPDGAEQLDDSALDLLLLWTGREANKS